MTKTHIWVSCFYDVTRSHRAPTVREVFFYLTHLHTIIFLLPSIFSLIETISLKIWETTYSGIRNVHQFRFSSMAQKRLLIKLCNIFLTETSAANISPWLFYPSFSNIKATDSRYGSDKLTDLRRMKLILRNPKLFLQWTMKWCMKYIIHWTADLQCFLKGH